MMRFIKTHQRENGVAATILLLNLVLLSSGGRYFTWENFGDLFMANAPVLIVSLGMMLIVLTGRIDISVGSQFAVCSVLAGVCAKAGLSAVGAGLAACLAGALFGAASGALTAWLRVPSIVVTLAMMIALRDGLRWLAARRVGRRPAFELSVVQPLAGKVRLVDCGRGCIARRRVGRRFALPARR